ncbi:MAG: guanylate kinase [Planctomycetota bacterium]
MSKKKSKKKSRKKAKPKRAKKKPAKKRAKKKPAKKRAAKKRAKPKRAKKKPAKKRARKVKAKRAKAKKRPARRTAPRRTSARKVKKRPAPEPLVPPGTGGLLVVLSGPSGAGKSTLARELARAESRIWRSVSMTTRAPREGEHDCIDYIFVSREEFERARAGRALLESAVIHGELYGTPRTPVVERLLQGRDVLFEIDVQGAMQVKKKAPEAILIFVRPPSRAVLETRLRERGTESEEKIQARLGAAAEEILRARAYDYLVVNDDVERAVSEIVSVMTAERSRVRRRFGLPW